MWGWIAADATAYVYHRTSHRFEFHRKHHEQPACVQTMLRASIASGTTFLLAAIATGQRKPMAAYWLGATILHPVFHHKQYSEWMPHYLRQRHESHHRHPATKFGPLHPVWDLIGQTEHPRDD